MTAVPFTTYLASTHLKEVVLLQRACKQMAGPSATSEPARASLGLDW